MRISDWSSDVCSSDLASLGTEALRLSALAAASIFDPTCFLAVHEGGQAIIAFLLLGGTLRFSGYDDHLRLLLAAVALVFAGTATCVTNPLVPLPVLQIGSASCRERVCQYV